MPDWNLILNIFLALLLFGIFNMIVQFIVGVGTDDIE